MADETYNAFEPQQDPKTGAWWYYDPSQQASQTQGWARVPTPQGVKLSKDDAVTAIGEIRKQATPQPFSPAEQALGQVSPLVAGQQSQPTEAGMAPAAPAPQPAAAAPKPGPAPKHGPLQFKEQPKPEDTRSLPEMLRDEAINYWKDSPGVHGMVMRRFAEMAPSSWPGVAAMAATMFPGGGVALKAAEKSPELVALLTKYPAIAQAIAKLPAWERMGFMGKIGLPTVAGAATGAVVPNETTASGAGTGAATGLGAAALNYVGGKLAGSPRVQMLAKQSADFFKRAGEKVGPFLAKTLKADLPILSRPEVVKAGIKLDNMEDVAKLAEKSTVEKAGVAFDKIEKQINKVLAGKQINMPVVANVSEVTGEAETAQAAKGVTRATTRSAGKSATTGETTARTATGSTAKTGGKTVSETQSMKLEPEDPYEAARQTQSERAGETVRKAGTKTESRRAGQSTSEGTRVSEAQRETTGRGQSARTAKTTTVSRKTVVNKPMTAEEAFKYRKELVSLPTESGEPGWTVNQEAYRQSGEAIEQALRDAKKPGLANKYAELRNQYADLMSWARTFHGRGDAFPGGRGFSPLHFYETMRSGAQHLDPARFGNLYRFMQPKAGFGPIAQHVEAMPFYAHPMPGVPIGVHAGAKGGIGQTMEGAVANALAPERGNILARLGLPPQVIQRLMALYGGGAAQGPVGTLESYTGG